MDYDASELGINLMMSRWAYERPRTDKFIGSARREIPHPPGTAATAGGSEAAKTGCGGCFDGTAAERVTGELVVEAHDLSASFTSG
jgi:hypothetical protein